MPRGKNSAVASKPVEEEPEEQVDLGAEEVIEEEEEEEEEEVEYEEVEEEVEEEEEEIEEEEEVEEEQEEEEEEQDVGASNGNDEERHNNDEAEDMKTDENDANESEMHAELLALPPHGSEVYVGGIPKDATEEELRGICEPIGEVTEVRIMKGKDSSENKGYAFVTFRTKELAQKAIEDLNNTEVKGRKLKFSSSQAKHRLFIGNVPKSWGEEDLRKVVTEIGPGIVGIELLKDPQNSSRNRGFAFIEYYNHACADYSKQKMSNPKFKLDGNAPTISWADPKNSSDNAASAQVKAIYVKNLPKGVTQEQLKELFEHHGEITKVVLPPAKPGHENSGFGFIHFAERSSAMKALKNTEKYELNGQVLECSLAKPQADKKSDGPSNTQKTGLISSYPRVGYGVMGGAYGALGAGYGAGLAQPMIYGRGPTPAGMTMVPMLLPDGRIGYVLQQPPIAASASLQRGGGRSGGAGSSGRSSGSKTSGGDNRGRRYRPY